MIDLTPLIDAIIAFVSVFLPAYVFPMLKKKMSAEEYELLMKIAEQGVLAAEQIMSGSKLGKEKKEYVMNYIKTTLKEKNMTVNMEDINTAIEAAVKQMNEAKALSETK